MDSTVYNDLEFKFVGIVCWGRSGTYFVQSLLDNHPQVLSIPPVAAITQFYDRWPEMSKFEKQSQLIDYIVDWLAEALDARHDREEIGLNLMGPKRDSHLYVDTDIFRLNLKYFLPPQQSLTRRRALIALYLAYEKSLGNDIREKFLIVHPLHNPTAYNRFEAALHDFPDLVVIGMMREPMRAFHSFLRFMSQGLNVSYPTLVRRNIYNHYYKRQLHGWTPTERKFPARFLTIKLESLHKSPKETIETLANSLKIRFHEHLMMSTFNKLEWWGDRSSAAPMQGFRGNSVEDLRFENHFTKNDKIVLYGLIGKKLLAEGYGSISIVNKILIPLRIFVPNRLEYASYLESLQAPSLLEKMRIFAKTFTAQCKRIAFSLKWYIGRDISQ